VDNRVRNDVKFLFEMGSLRHVQRTWRQFGGVPYANVAEHTLRVAWIAMILAEREDADSAKVLKLAMIHDIPEIRTGDVNYMSRMYADRHEDEALEDMVQGTDIQAEILYLWREFDARETLESRIVKDADTLDCDLELKESEAVGYSLLSVLSETRDRAYGKLYTKSARALFDEIYAADPHRWHKDAKNRMTTGDWRPE
jgi:5'-deoxynucleotidase YfbR-like HD superfamily hydrolase